MEIRDQIRQFIIDNFYVPVDHELDARASLLDTGLVDSTGVLEVISFIESAFGITVADTETLPENLDSIERIASFVVRKRAEQG